jgi:hypothetical protein
VSRFYKEKLGRWQLPFMELPVGSLMPVRSPTVAIRNTREGLLQKSQTGLNQASTALNR